MPLLCAKAQHSAAQGSEAGHELEQLYELQPEPAAKNKTCSNRCTLPRQKSFSKPQNNKQSQLLKGTLGTNTLHSPNWQNLHLIYNIVKVTGKKLNRKCEKAYYILHKCTNFCTKPLDVMLSPPVLASYGP